MILRVEMKMRGQNKRNGCTFVVFLYPCDKTSRISYIFRETKIYVCLADKRPHTKNINLFNCDLKNEECMFQFTRILGQKNVRISIAIFRIVIGKRILIQAYKLIHLFGSF